MKVGQGHSRHEDRWKAKVVRSSKARVWKEGA